MAEEKLKYLEFLQAAITRMGSNSFLVKGWSVTLGTAVLGFSVKESNWALALIAVFPAGVFWALDAYYLALETLFRDLWEKAVASEGVTFNMRPGALYRAQWVAAAKRPAVWLVHCPIILVSALASGVMASLRCVHLAGHG
jgi:hypothetical protein